METDTVTPPEAVTRDDLVDALAGLVTREQFDAVVDDVRRDALIDRGRGETGHPLARFRSLVDYADTLWQEGPANMGLLTRALADQITTNNPGVIPPAWVTSVAGIVDQSRPTISAFGAVGLPASGMELTWPYFDGDLTALVGEQLVEKSPIVSVRVDLKRGTEPIRTFAGGSDLSYQLIRRSEPSYRDAYLRIMLNAYAITTNAAAALDATNAATASTGVWDPVAGDLSALAMALFTASVEVSRATGAPASFVLAGESAFIAAGVLAVAAATSSGNVNPASTASAATLAVSVAGLPIVFDPSLADGVMLVSNNLTAKWHEDGPFTVTAEDIEKLGQNVAVWGMGAFATSLPAGIRRIDDGIVAARSSGKKSTDEK